MPSNVNGTESSFSNSNDSNNDQDYGGGDESGEEGSIGLAGLDGDEEGEYQQKHDHEDEDEHSEVLESPQLSVRKKASPSMSFSHRDRRRNAAAAAAASSGSSPNNHRHSSHADSHPLRSPRRQPASNHYQQQHLQTPSQRRTVNTPGIRVKSKAAGGAGPAAAGLLTSPARDHGRHRHDDDARSSVIDEDVGSWGNKSLPHISLKELGRSEKHATEAETVHSAHQRTTVELSPQKRPGSSSRIGPNHHHHTNHHNHHGHRPSSSRSVVSSSISVTSAPVVDPAGRIQEMIKTRRVKEGRRTDVKNSLASFLETNDDHDDIDDGLQVEEERADDDIVDDDATRGVGRRELHKSNGQSQNNDEDDSLISDDEETHRTDQHQQHFGSPRTGVGNDYELHEDSDISRSQSAKQLVRTTRASVDEIVSPTSGSGGSSHSRSTMIHRRSRTTSSSDDSSVCSRKIRRHARPSSTRAVENVGKHEGGYGDGDGNGDYDAHDDNRSRRVLRRTRDARSVDRSTRDARSVERGRSGQSVGASARRSRRSVSRGADTVSRDAHSDNGSRRGVRSRSRTRGDETDDKAGRSEQSDRTGDSVRRSRSKSRSRDAGDDQSVVSRKSVATAASRRGRRPSRPRHTKPSHNRLPPHSHADPSSCDDQVGSPTKIRSPIKDAKPKSRLSLANHLASDEDAKEKQQSFEDASETSSRDKSQVVLLQFDPTNADLVQTVNQSGARKTSEVIRHADGTESELQISELAGLPTFEKTNPESLLHDSATSMNHELGPPSSQRSMSSVEGGSSVEGNKYPSSFNRSRRPPSSSKSFAGSILQLPGEPPSEKAGGGGRERRPPMKSKSAAVATARQRGVQATASFFSRMNRSRGNMAVTHQELDDDGGSDED